MKSPHRFFLPFAALFAACAALPLIGCHRSQTAAAPTTPKPIASTVPTAPPPPPQPAVLPPEGVRAIYLSGWIAGTKHRFAELVDLVDRTELNAMVIDVKDDGRITYKVDVPLAHEVAEKCTLNINKGNMKMTAHIDKVLETLEEHHIFPIARIACFRDTPLAEVHPEMAVQDANGKVWHDRSHHAWLNPYNRAAWDYNVDIALDALKHGFKEIQFDYVRFPSEGDLSKLHFPGRPENAKREDQIAAFLEYAREKIKAQGGWFSADIFGLTSLVTDDEGIGQKFSKVAKTMDYLCPMVYPSHYAHGEYGIKNPNAEPYKIIFLSVGDAKKKLVDSKTCKLRPWIQDFSLGGIHYGPAQVKAQIKALNDLGIKEYLLWNAGNKYTEAAFAKAERPVLTQKPASNPAPNSPAVGSAPIQDAANPGSKPVGKP